MRQIQIHSESKQNIHEQQRAYFGQLMCQTPSQTQITMLAAMPTTRACRIHHEKQRRFKKKAPGRGSDEAGVAKMAKRLG